MNIFKRQQRDLRVKIDLPKGWNYLTTEQMEKVSAILIESAKKYNATGLYSQGELFARVFFELSGLRVMPNSSLLTPNSEDKYYDCEFIDEEKRKTLQMVDGKIAPIRIYVSEVAAITHLLPTEIDKKGNIVPPTGGLNWLLQPSDVVKFPYPEVELLDISSPKKARVKVKFEGPGYLMSNFTWRQYRNACDFMSYLSKMENTLVAMQKNSAAYGATKVAQQNERVKKVRAQFLATLFNRQVEHIDRETGNRINDYFYVSSQCHDNEHFFLDWSEAKFQCVSLWWQGMMNYLSKQYPKVFKKEKVGKASDDDPFKLYTRSTTTMIKYSQSNEEEVNRTTYTIILQHINDMAEENERIEQMKSSHKH